MKFTITTLNDNGSGMEFTKKEDFLREIAMMIADCIENGGTRFDIEVDSNASCFAPEGCIAETHKSPMELEESKEPISILVRDCNGKRTNLVFNTRNQILNWAEKYMLEDDEILVITQGNICLYSGLGSDIGLTCDDITGFFA